MGFLSGLLGGKKMSTGYANEMTDKALKLQRQIYEEGRADVAPWLQTGKQGLDKLSYFLGVGENTPGKEGYGSLLDTFGTEDFQASPSYNFNLGEGEKAINRAAAAAGRYQSPSAVTDYIDYATGLASNEFSNAYNMDMNNKQSIYNMLAGISDSGQQATGQTAAIGANYAAGATDLYGQKAQLDVARQNANNARRQSAFSNLLSIGKTAAAFSDIRLKENIKLVGIENGHNIYEFDYKDGSGRYRGVMAHEVEKIEPDAVKTHSNGYKMVFYDKIGLKMERA